MVGEIKFGSISDTIQPKKVETSTEKGIMPDISDMRKLLPTEEVEKMIAETTTDDNIEIGLSCMIIGQNGTGKSGITQDYVCNLPKKVIIIDLDGHNVRLLKTYHIEEYKSKKVVVLQPFSMKENAETQDVSSDYVATFSKIKAIIKYVSDHHEEYSAIVLDGMSELLKYAENQMRMDKHLTPDGGVEQRYWKNRADKFRDVLDGMRNIPKIDKIYVAQEDFIIKEKTAMIKVGTHQLMAQRILCRKIETVLPNNGGNIIEFVAKIDKSKFNLSLEGKEIKFGRVEKGISSWDTSNIFKGL